MPTAPQPPFRRLTCATLLVALIALPFLIYAALQSVRGMHTDPIAWVSPQDPERQRYVRFLEMFERESAIVVSWQGCMLSDQRIDLFAAELQDSDAEVGWIDRVISGRSVIRTLVAGEMKVQPTTAAARLRGILLGEDTSTVTTLEIPRVDEVDGLDKTRTIEMLDAPTCAIVILTDSGIQARGSAIQKVRQLAASVGNMDESAVRIGGGPAQAAAIDDESTRMLSIIKR